MAITDTGILKDKVIVRYLTVALPYSPSDGPVGVERAAALVDRRRGVIEFVNQSDEDAYQAGETPEAQEARSLVELQEEARKLGIPPAEITPTDKRRKVPTAEDLKSAIAAKLAENERRPRRA